jgi:hypothetical protein
MTAAELIAELLAVPPDTQIRVYADHGQMCLEATTSGLQKIRKSQLDQQVCDTIHPDDITDDPEEFHGVDLVDIFEIGAP